MPPHLPPQHLAVVSASGLRAWFAWTDSPKFSVLASGVAWDKAPSPHPVTAEDRAPTPPRSCGRRALDVRRVEPALATRALATVAPTLVLGFAWHCECGSQLPDTLRGRGPDPLAKNSNTEAHTLATQLQAWLQGNPDPLPLDALDLTMLSPFSRQVLTTLQTTVPRGQVTTYGALAAACGMPGAARAVGNALRNNPFPLFLPCHRVISASGRIGGFQGGPDGSPLKARLLALEGVTEKSIEPKATKEAKN